MAPGFLEGVGIFIWGRESEKESRTISLHSLPPLLSCVSASVAPCLSCLFVSPLLLTSCLSFAAQEEGV